MRLKSLDLFLAMGIAVANVVWAVLTTSAGPASPSLIGVVLAVPLVFLAPGYLITETLFPNRALEPVQRLVFTLALSIAFTIFGGFLLNLFPAGLRMLPWTLWLGALTTIFTLLAFLRRQRAPQPAEQRVQPQRIRVPFATFILFGMAALVIGLSVLYSVVGAEQQPHPGFTNLWIVPATQGSNTCAVSIGIQSFELAPTSYRVVVTGNKDQLANWTPISLVPEQQWVQLEPISVGNNTSMVILVQLYRLDKPAVVYRHTDLTLYVSSKGTSKQCWITSVFPSYRNIANAYNGNLF
jgi:uncharacterized membrane protein